MKQETLRYAIIVTDKKGKVIKRLSGRSKSYVKAWNQIISVQASFINQTFKDTSGADQVVGGGSDTFLSAEAAAGDLNRGIRVGKGTTAVDITDYALESPCGEGTGLDQFSHQIVTFTVPSVAGPTCSFTITRTMINNSGATISGIKELGCYIEADSPVVHYFLGFRDVLGTVVDVPDGGAITVEYTIGVTA